MTFKFLLLGRKLCSCLANFVVGQATLCLIFVLGYKILELFRKLCGLDTCGFAENLVVLVEKVLIGKEIL